MEKKMIAMFLTGALLYSCASKQDGGEPSTYKTLAVRTSDATLKSEYTATLAGQQQVEIRPQVSGLITRICIGEGEEVHEGQVLFVIDQVPYRAALDGATANVRSAEAKLASARLTAESTKTLRENNVVSDFDLSMVLNELAAAEAALAQAKSQEMTARNNLSYTEVKSPVNGIAGMIAYRVGALVSSSIQEPLVTVSDDSHMYAYFSLSESRMTDLMEQYGSLQAFISQMPEVELRMSNGKMYAEKGRINAVSGIVTAGTGSVTLRADFPNENGLLRNGGSGSVILPSSHEHCIVIPQTATYELQNRVFVYKVVEGKAQSAPVEVFNLNNGKDYIVESGLTEGDVIIAEGAGLVREGAVVIPNTKK
ncbi:MAG: efflux RND transporter periplasmic adaptor subunit [Bacteroides sp.]|nr:efflux RND transporter periplasmic adaptor subunit [Roseburia sp.]MCM1347716.1 efflux RND transporter periplasmic adaptor subunit [Bacteroides sp.]MCM1421395.1 efflux RND transporter periplasmic adaptor subunit [Bacteroides sp.]